MKPTDRVIAHSKVTYTHLHYVYDMYTQQNQVHTENYIHMHLSYNLIMTTRRAKLNKWVIYTLLVSF